MAPIKGSIPTVQSGVILEFMYGLYMQNKGFVQTGEALGLSSCIYIPKHQSNDPESPSLACKLTIKIKVISCFNHPNAGLGGTENNLTGVTFQLGWVGVLQLLYQCWA